MKCKIALAQTETCADLDKNIETAKEMAKQAKENGASVVIFPEIFIAAFPADASLEEKLASAHDMESPAVKEMAGIARENSIWMIFGMYEPVYQELEECSRTAGNEKGSRAPRNYNTTVVIDDQGQIKATYHKTHLYDAFSYKESDFNVAGDELFQPIDTPFGKMGLMVCYEARFPEIARYQAKKGAEIIIMPTAWFDGKGKAEQLQLAVCSRAMDNTVFVAMCDMCGGKRVGESMLAGPYGNVIVQAGREKTLLMAEYDTDEIYQVRKTLPVLENRRPELYC